MHPSEPVLVRAAPRRVSERGDPARSPVRAAANRSRGGIWLKAGADWAAGFIGNVDSLTAAVNVGGVNGTVTYDFEP